MSLRTSLQRLTRRDPDALTLKERGAALKAGLAKTRRRPETPAATPPEAIPAPASDLAAACDWAVGHMARIDAASKAEDWTDADTDRGLAQHDAVFARAIAEPSTDLRTLAAKGRLALEDFERFRVDAKDHIDDTDRMVLTVLREVSAIAVPEIDAADPIFAAIAEHRAAYADWDRTSAVWNDMLSDDPGFEAAYAASAEPRERETAAMEALITARPTTLAGVQALAEYLPGAIRRVNTHDEESDGERALRSIAAALRALSPSPHALSVRILDLWSAWAATEGPDEIPEDETAWEDMDRRRHALLNAAEALPATREAIIPKALALTWIEYAQLWERGRKRAGYGTDGRLALDIHAAVTAEPASASPVAPTPHPDINLVDRLDLATATMEDLRALRDVADMVAGVAYAATWQERCKARGPGGHYNVAGTLMQDLADALTDVEGAAAQEARRRTPGSSNDRGARLKLIAPMIIQNGDPEEVAELAREMTEHATATWGPR